MTDQLSAWVARMEEIVGEATPLPIRADPCWSQIYLGPDEFVAWGWNADVGPEAGKALRGYNPTFDKQAFVAMRSAIWPLLKVVSEAAFMDRMGDDITVGLKLALAKLAEVELP